MSDKMTTARGRLALYAGFWMVLASKLEWVARTDTPGGVAATNGRQVYYNPAKMNERPIGEVTYIALHEIGHNAWSHITRAALHPTWDQECIAIAIDMAVNEMCDMVATDTPLLHLTRPGDAITCQMFGGGYENMAWEEKYKRLCQRKKQKPNEFGGNKDGKGGFDVHLRPRDANGKPLKPSEIEALGKEWQIALQSAAVAAKKMGKLPGFLDELIAESVKPKVDWRTHLLNCMHRITRDESSWRRLNRRHIARKTYLPGYYDEQLNAVAYFADTSGSISSQECKAAKGAMEDILEELKPSTIYFGQCDTKLHSVDELKPDDLPLPALTIHGRGGTDMREAFQWACENEHLIDAFILQTDGYVPALDPSLHPNVPVIILLTSKAELPSGWDIGTHIHVEI